MKVKAILWRWPGGGGGVPGPGPPRRAAAPWGVATLHPSLRDPAVPLCRVWRRDVTGPPRPQPGRERKAAPGAVAAAGPSDQLGQFSRPLLPERSRPSVAAAAVRVEDAVDVWAGPGGPKLGALGEESRAAEPPGPGPRSPDSEPHSASPQLRDREAARPESGKEGGGQAAKVRSVSWWSFEIVLGPRKLSPCACRVTQRTSSNSRKAWGRPPSQLGSPSYPPLSHPPHLLSLMKQSDIFDVGVGFFGSNQNRPKFTKITWSTHFVS